MSKQATLEKVRVDGDVAIFQINAPAVASALTRKANSGSTEELRSTDISRSLLERLIAALHTSDLVFKRNDSGKWYVRATLPASAPAPEQKPRIEDKGVVDTDGKAPGLHKCQRCAGTGRYFTRIENGRPAGGGGQCFRCGGKGFTNQGDRKRNWGHDVNYVPAS